MNCNGTQMFRKKNGSVNTFHSNVEINGRNKWLSKSYGNKKKLMRWMGHKSQIDGDKKRDIQSYYLRFNKTQRWNSLRTHCSEHCTK